jgi:hypothetical protein
MVVFCEDSHESPKEPSAMNINELTLELKKFLSANQLNKIAKKSNFIIRNRKITALDFVKNMMFAGVRDTVSSLEYITSLFGDDGISLTKQSLSSKINKQAVAFLEEVFEALCKQFGVQKFLGRDCKFTDVKILDSSEIKLNKKLADFKNKQNGPRCKLQAAYGLLTNTLNCEITKANKNDQGYKNYLDHVKQNDLIMFDLGYFSLESFREIINKEAYFVSRLPKTTAVMDLEGTNINLNLLLKNSNNTIDMKVLVGRESRLPCRFIAKKLEGEALKSRMKKLSCDALRAGKKQKSSSEIDFWSIYLTNREEESASEIYNLYALRWQIELLFKVLKSKLSMGYIKDNNPDKAMIIMYGKLISLVVMMILIRSIDEVEVSLYKAVDYYKEQIKTICIDIIKGRIKKLEGFLLKVRNFAQKSKNKNRPSSLERSSLRIVFSSA